MRLRELWLRKPMIWEAESNLPELEETTAKDKRRPLRTPVLKGQQLDSRTSQETTC